MTLLDTNALLWWLDGGGELSKVARGEIGLARKSGEIYVSAISAWELALLVKKKRVVIEMSMEDWVRELTELEFVKVIPVDAETAVESVNLPGEFHKDPADRIIVATARRLGAKLVTKDKKILGYDHVQAVW
ncbi:twitching motility protein PilT [Candidatus Amesbacteria bacterium RIFCSPHIGHO2_01_FULL_48_32]|uniref:Ribonuclease VapC n=1 Tax=Candidatus Amesbacteria bacterium RIFCSPLOWO2_01_FULL_48_25 TaxID=1797259 RepID=A0A1F4ZDG9_9BACT|nr:MAG: twitching motility protein PilT [Candidatus Amesbacteria bacterium RIFCSPHIGHO2_01_FULL_48_32]OGD04292.1 MAG: twitching motility protein PilT [Candidatus Amesbacteria bacterium RIFCSPLOWO2_01_FULL_48_25]HJZ05491.1 type II toxin-antitoxin system VapC family toxin [Patescibacteria group bacterium]